MLNKSEILLGSVQIDELRKEVWCSYQTDIIVMLTDSKWLKSSEYSYIETETSTFPFLCNGFLLINILNLKTAWVAVILLIPNI